MLFFTPFLIDIRVVEELPMRQRMNSRRTNFEDASIIIWALSAE